MHVPALIEFLEGLRRNNNRPWFIWNKPAYDILRRNSRSWSPMLLFASPGSTPSLARWNAKKAMFRFYRDMRFAKDKTPYETHFSAALGDRSKRGQAPGYYFRIDHAGTLFVGGGIYRPHPPILLRIRRHIATKPEALSRVLRDRRFKATYGGLADEDSLARPPKGFAADSPHIDAIKCRHFFAGVEINIAKPPPR